MKRVPLGQLVPAKLRHIDPDDFLTRLTIACLTGVMFSSVFVYDWATKPGWDRRTLAVLGVIHGLMALLTFWRAGREFITVSSMFSYGQLVFASIPAILTGIGQVKINAELSIGAIAAILACSYIFQTFLFLYAPGHGYVKHPRIHLDLTHPSAFRVQALSAAVAMISILSAMTIKISFINNFLNPMIIISFGLSSAVFLSRPWNGRQSFYHFLILFGIVAAYTLIRFSGMGRLNLASYYLLILVIYSWLRPGVRSKLAILAGTIPALVLLVLVRMYYVYQNYGRMMSESESFSSVTAPLIKGAVIFQSAWNGQITPKWGTSLFTSLIFWIPRAVWPDKPVGFGRAIVPVTAPKLASIPNQSDAALFLAEMVWDFGFLLLPVYMILILIAIVQLDRRLLRLVSGSSVDVFYFVLHMMLPAITIHYIWAGSFTLMSRMAIPIGFLFIAHWLVARFGQPKEQEADPLISGEWEQAPPIDHAIQRNGALDPIQNAEEVHRL